MSQNGRKMAKMLHNAAKKFDWVLLFPFIAYFLVSEPFMHNSYWVVPWACFLVNASTFSWFLPIAVLGLVIWIARFIIHVSWCAVLAARILINIVSGGLFLDSAVVCTRVLASAVLSERFCVSAVLVERFLVVKVLCTHSFLTFLCAWFFVNWFFCAFLGIFLVCVMLYFSVDIIEIAFSCRQLSHIIFK